MVPPLSSELRYIKVVLTCDATIGLSEPIQHEDCKSYLLVSSPWLLPLLSSRRGRLSFFATTELPTKTAPSPTPWKPTTASTQPLKELLDLPARSIRRDLSPLPLKTEHRLLSTSWPTRTATSPSPTSCPLPTLFLPTSMSCWKSLSVSALKASYSTKRMNLLRKLYVWK
ncbi:uncharacterized protein LOC125031610 [Penaeus chinensis]|uniref:uncharacterized protein LOC125031610 n=1 Tax=Penaeus chinensis TaxID=139456 RepID=UPI001FB81A45|nr:uncharacterized protein LOC125031610 [Penaeus chinensis]